MLICIWRWICTIKLWFSNHIKNPNFTCFFFFNAKGWFFPLFSKLNNIDIIIRFFKSWGPHWNTGPQLPFTTKNAKTCHATFFCKILHYSNKSILSLPLRVDVYYWTSIKHLLMDWNNFFFSYIDDGKYEILWQKSLNPIFFEKKYSFVSWLNKATKHV